MLTVARCSTSDRLSRYRGNSCCETGHALVDSDPSHGHLQPYTEFPNIHFLDFVGQLYHTFQREREVAMRQRIEGAEVVC